MPNRGGRKRTNLESKAFKAEIIRLRGQNKSIVKIAKQLKVSRQYVSLVLIEAGLGTAARLPAMQDRVKDNNQNRLDDVDATESRLKQSGEYSLAALLRAVVQKRKG